MAKSFEVLHISEILDEEGSFCNVDVRLSFYDEELNVEESVKFQMKIVVDYQDKLDDVHNKALIRLRKILDLSRDLTEGATIAEMREKVRPDIDLSL